MGTAAALALVIGVAVVTALIALPLALRKIPRNRLYGVRTRRTLADDRVWYETNAYGGRCLMAASAVAILMVGILYVLTPLTGDALVLAGVAALVVPSLVAAVLAVRHAGRISR
ncbi:MAG TPA: SdpI family protein [Methylomirabilota bacterium]|nr:SdpI family protein [Methylomirabilota bacterium]